MEEYIPPIAVASTGDSDIRNLTSPEPSIAGSSSGRMQSNTPKTRTSMYLEQDLAELAGNAANSQSTAVALARLKGLAESPWQQDQALQAVWNDQTKSRAVADQLLKRFVKHASKPSAKHHQTYRSIHTSIYTYIFIHDPCMPFDCYERAKMFTK